MQTHWDTNNIDANEELEIPNPAKQRLITPLIELAREKGVSVYVGDRLNRRAAVHRGDATRVYVLALEKRVAGSRYHAVAEEGIAAEDRIAEVIGRGPNIPVESIVAADVPAHFGWLSAFVGAGMAASSELPQRTNCKLATSANCGSRSAAA